jgi:NAD(P)-dependent dehydrogenase (short-subunit alcohol dehydrogenase family)
LLDKKVILVTGATSGIGRAVCNVLSEKGHKVYGTGRRAEHFDSLDNFTLLKADVDSYKSVEQAVNTLIEKEGKIDVLINNAGIGMAGAIEDSLVKEVMMVFDTNVAGPIRMCQAVIPHMRQQNAGLIINISSVGGLMGLPFRGVYSASKAAIETGTEALSMEVMQFGIKVVLVEPGDFKTGINEHRYVSEATKSSIYKKDFDRIYSIIEEEVSNGEDPKRIGELIHKIINTKHPKLRYNVGNFNSKLALILKKALPNRWFERIMMSHYKIKRS